MRKRHVPEEIELLRAAVAKTGNAIMAKAIADSQGIGNDDVREPVSPKLAASLAKRRGDDDEARAVVSMAYVTSAFHVGATAAEPPWRPPSPLAARSRRLRRSGGRTLVA